MVYNFKRIYTYSILLKTVDKTGLKETCLSRNRSHEQTSVSRDVLPAVPITQ